MVRTVKRETIQENFIALIAPTAQLICPKYKLFPSVCIAQACLESGWGRARPELSAVYNYFGRKWHGKGN